MPAQPGTVPSMFQSRALVAGVRLHDAEIWHQYPVSALFGEPVVYADSEFVVHIIDSLRKLGTDFFSGPHAGTPIELESYTKKILSALYVSKVFEIAPGVMNRMVDLEGVLAMGGDGNRSIALMLQQLQRVQAKGIQDRGRYCRRMFEKLAINMLTSQSITVSIDGVSRSLNLFGLTVTNAGTDWDTDTHDIRTEWAGWMRAFKQRAGGPPTHILLPPTFWDSFVVPNDHGRDFAYRNPSIVTENAASLLEMTATAPADRSTTVIEVMEQYDNDDGNGAQNMWPEGKMVWIRNPSACLEHATVATKDNDYNGGLWSYLFESTNPKSDGVNVNMNALPFVTDTTQVECFDLTPP